MVNLENPDHLDHLDVNHLSNILRFSRKAMTSKYFFVRGLCVYIVVLRDITTSHEVPQNYHENHEAIIIIAIL